MSDTELGWQPLVASWLAKRKPSEAALLQPAFDRYVERMLQFVRWGHSGKLLLLCMHALIHVCQTWTDSRQHVPDSQSLVQIVQIPDMLLLYLHVTLERGRVHSERHAWACAG